MGNTHSFCCCLCHHLGGDTITAAPPNAAAAVALRQAAGVTQSRQTHLPVSPVCVLQRNPTYIDLKPADVGVGFPTDDSNARALQLDCPVRQPTRISLVLVDHVHDQSCRKHCNRIGLTIDSANALEGCRERDKVRARCASLGTATDMRRRCAWYRRRPATTPSVSSSSGSAGEEQDIDDGNRHDAAKGDGERCKAMTPPAAGRKRVAVDAADMRIGGTIGITTYQLTLEDVGCFIYSVFSTFPNGHPDPDPDPHGSAAARSQVIGPVQPAEPQILRLRVVSAAVGPLSEGHVLRMEGEYSGGHEGRSMFQWLRIYADGRRQPMAAMSVESRSYRLQAADVGCRIKGRWLPIRDDGKRGAVATSKPTSVTQPMRWQVDTVRLRRERAARPGAPLGYRVIAEAVAAIPVGIDGSACHALPGGHACFGWYRSRAGIASQAAAVHRDRVVLRASSSRLQRLRAMRETKANYESISVAVSVAVKDGRCLASYTPAEGDQGRRLRVTVTPINKSGGNQSLCLAETSHIFALDTAVPLAANTAVV